MELENNMQRYPSAKSALSTHDGPIYVNVYMNVLQNGRQKRNNLTLAEKHKVVSRLGDRQFREN